MSDIRIIHEPKVRLVGRQVIDRDQLDAFLSDEGVEDWTTDTDVAGQKLVEVAGRLCYKSYAKPRPGGNAAYLGHILEVGHGSVCEHAVFNFIITGVSRSFTHELVRHRAGWAYSQRSQRYCDEADFAAVMPPLIGDLIDWDRVPGQGHAMRDDLEFDEIDELWSMWKDAIDSCRFAYEQLSNAISGRLLVRNLPANTWYNGLEPESFAEMNDVIASLPSLVRTAMRKQAREAARSVLPNATETQIFVTANARALRHFIEARGDESADAEIRSVALAILDILRMEAPGFVADYRDEDRPGVGRIASTPHSKV